MADLGLPDTVDAPEALFQPVGVPRQVVVHHQMRAALQVHPFPRRVVGDQETDRRIVVEGGDRGPSPISRNPAVDHRDRAGLSRAVPDAAREIFERVAGLGEDHELAPGAGRTACGAGDQRIVEDPVELPPLGVLARPAERRRQRLQPAELRDLRFELGDGPRCGRAIDQPVLVSLPLLSGVVFVEVVFVERRFGCGRRDRPIPVRGGAGGRVPFLLETRLEARAPAFERFVDRGGRRRQTPLQGLEREADVVAPPGAVAATGAADPVGAIHLFLHVSGDRAVERRFSGREPVGDRVGPPFREQGAPVETDQLFLGEAPHHVGGVGLVDAFAKAALEAIRVQQPHEQLEVLFLAVMGRRGHEDEMAREPAGQDAELETPSVFDLLPEEARRHAVRLVADDQVPHRRGFEPGLEVVVARQHVEPRDEARLVGERVAGRGGLDLLAAQDVEREVELVRQLVLPLLDQTAGRDDQAAFQAAPDQELLDEEAGHDRLAGARIVGQQES